MPNPPPANIPNNSNPNDYTDSYGGNQQTNSGGLLGGVTQGLFGGPGLNGAAPGIDQSGVGSALAQAQQGRAAQGQAMGLASQLARGQGPSAVSQAYNQQVNNSTAAANALASSTPGSQQAMARRQAMMTAAQGQQAAGQSAATGHVQEQLGGMGALGSMAGQQRGQDIQTGNLLGGLASNQAQLQEQQNQANLQAAEFQEKQNANSLTSMAGMAAGAMAFADAPHMPTGNGPTGNEMHLKEPGGPSHFILREEPDFLLMVNARTGRMGKIPMVPLTPEEQQQALRRPHGAGPIQNSMKALQYGDAQLSNLNEDPNQDNSGGALGSFTQDMGALGGGGSGSGAAGAAMAAADYHVGQIPQAVRSKHGALYYTDANMGDDGDAKFGADQADYDYQMSRADFDSLGPNGTSRDTSMPSYQPDGRLFGKYSTLGTGVGGGDAPANGIDENGKPYEAATGADPYAANPGKFNPATDADQPQKGTASGVFYGAMKGYADPVHAMPKSNNVSNTSAPQSGSVRAPGVSVPVVVHDGTTAGPVDAQPETGTQQLAQLDQQRLGLSRVGEGNSVMGYKPQNIANTIDQKNAPTVNKERFVRDYNSLQNYGATDNDRRQMLNAGGISGYEVPTGPARDDDALPPSPPLGLGLETHYDPGALAPNGHGRGNWTTDYTASNSADEMEIERARENREDTGAPPPYSPYDDLPQGLDIPDHGGGYGSPLGEQSQDVVTQDQDGNDVSFPRFVRQPNGKIADLRMMLTPPSKSTAKPTPSPKPHPKPTILTKQFANRPRPRGKKAALQDLSARAKSA